MRYIILTLLLISSLCYAQGYDETIDFYTMHFLKVESGTMVSGSQMTSVVGDTALIFSWENGTELTPGYVTQLTGTYTILPPIDNIPSMWTAGSALLTRNIVLPSGLYEITLTCTDVAKFTSDHSQPIYLNVSHKTAKVQINFKVL